MIFFFYITFTFIVNIADIEIQVIYLQFLMRHLKLNTNEARRKKLYLLRPTQM